MQTPFTIYLMQSAHTDIGYTHPQEQLQSMYLEYYDRVLDLCRTTSTSPEAQRFKWTCETFWQVRHYLSHRPQREQEFLQYVRSGQIEITACYAHFTDLIDSDAYQRGMQLAVDYCREHDLPLRTAMHCDINGWSWSVADILADFHISYFVSHLNLDMGTDPLGKRGSLNYELFLNWHKLIRSDTPIRVPQAFWWQGPQGGSVLHWLNDQYLLGNMLGLSGTRGFHEDKTRYFTEVDRDSADDLYILAQERVPLYIERLRSQGYTNDMLLISSGGFYVDNSPPDDRWTRLIERWNTEHEDIRLRTATISEWFEALTQRTSTNYPTYQVAWPDSWAHGLGSTTARVAQARRTQRRRADVEALVAHTNSPAASTAFSTALEQERMALEHTFGAWSTTARPSSPLNSFQQDVKELFFHRAELYLNEAIGSALRANTQLQNSPTLYAGSSNRQSGMHLVHFTSEELRLDQGEHALTDSTGHNYPFQQEDRQLAQFVAYLPIKSNTLSAFSLGSTVAAPSIQHAQVTHSDGQIQIETQAWRLRIDASSGGLSSLYEHANNHEWVDKGHDYTFGQFVHETVVHPWGYQAVGNNARLIALDVANEELKNSYPAVPVFERSSPTMQSEPRITQGPIFDEVSLQSFAENFGPVRVAWRCYHALPLVEFVLDWDKTWSELPEAAYIAFPFVAQSLALETGGGFFQPGSHETGGQLPGTCSSYYTIQRAAQLTAQNDHQALWLPLDAPLVMTNELSFTRWETTPWQWNGFLASMPVNHYWHTNFPVSQRGPLRLRYRFLSQHDYPDVEHAIQTAMPVEALGWH
jgi:hypothetical protein